MSDAQGHTMLSVLTEAMLNEEAPVCLAALRDGVAAADMTSVARYAHRLKGSALVFGAARLAELCAVVEREPAAGANLLPDIAAALSELEAALTSAVTS